MRLGLVLGDQLSFDLASLATLDPARDAILMAEVEGEARYVPHHPMKIVLIFSAMRHFAQPCGSGVGKCIMSSSMLTATAVASLASCGAGNTPWAPPTFT